MRSKIKSALVTCRQSPITLIDVDGKVMKLTVVQLWQAYVNTIGRYQALHAVELKVHVS